MTQEGQVVATFRCATHSFHKVAEATITLRSGFGVEGDAHAGRRVKHRSRVKKDPDQPNLRQVHLVHGELFDELEAMGFNIAPGDIGENITTRGIALLDLPQDTCLHIGLSAVLQLTGLRNPCAQLDAFQDGLMAAVLDRDPDGNLVRKAGVMAIVLQGGQVRPGDPISVELPDPPFKNLQPV